MNIITITGQTCSGKSTLERDLHSALGYIPLRSVTTRKPRPGEVDGVHYDFVTEEEFHSLELIESIKFGNNYYGLPAHQLTDPNGTYVAVVEPAGRKQIAVFCRSQGVIFIPIFLTISGNLFASRFVQRMRIEQAEGVLNLDSIEQRLTLVMKELDWEPLAEELCFEYTAASKSNILAAIAREVNTVNSK